MACPDAPLTKLSIAEIITSWLEIEEFLIEIWHLFVLFTKIDSGTSLSPKIVILWNSL